MDAIRKRKHCFALLAMMELIVCTMILISIVNSYEVYLNLVLGIALLVTLLFLGLWYKEYKKLMVARLIAENQFLRILPIIIQDKTENEPKHRNTKDIEVLISYFGILSGSTIIKFNQDGIHLRAVEIGYNFITLTYGRDKRVQNICLLCNNMNKDELDEIVEKVKFETGIISTVIE